jgi:FMN phosphatase YigB (HAD superfamily)
MKPSMIIWDFDGTLIPNDPYDSEQTLMLYKLNEISNHKSFDDPGRHCPGGLKWERHRVLL